MNKKTLKHPVVSKIALYMVILAVLGVGAATISTHTNRKKARREVSRLNGEIYKNKSALHAYMINAKEFEENRQMKKTLDSLKHCNVKMFGDAQERYYERIDKKYPMGRFMNATQIRQLNHMIMPYVNKIKKSDNNAYTLVHRFTPLTSRTTMSEFECMLHLVDIPPEKFAPFDMIVDGGFLFFFNDAKQQKLYEKYLEELSKSFSEFHENEPNFEIRENAEIRDEYIANQDKIRNLEFMIEQNDFLIGQNIAQFGHINDSLVELRTKYQSKLKSGKSR